MTAGPVNRALLESFYQNPGDIYDDSKTEGAFDVIADQIDDNWTDYSVVKTALNSTTLGSSGTQYVQSPTIVGVTGNNAYLQLLSLKAQIDAIVGASIPPGSVTYDKLAPSPTIAPASGILPLWDASGNLHTNTAVNSIDAVNLGLLNTRLSTIMQFVTGTYTGNGGSGTRTVSIPGITPKVIFISAGVGSTADSYASLTFAGLPAAMLMYGNGSQFVSKSEVTSALSIPTPVSGGFTVDAATAQTSGGLNVNGRAYGYIAFY